MKNYTSLKLPFKSERRRNMIAAFILILLPLVLGGIYIAQQFRSSANVLAKPEAFVAERLSGTSARMSFETGNPVKATVLCSVTTDGVRFFCGEDESSTTKHLISTNDFGINLNTGQGYYVFSNIVEGEEPIGYIPADVEDPTFGLTTNSYTEATLGLCWGDEGYDPQLDVDQDGCVYTNDLVQLYE